MELVKLQIDLEDNLTSEYLEKLEDKLAELLGKELLHGEIYDYTTGNSTRFPRDKEEE